MQTLYRKTLYLFKAAWSVTFGSFNFRTNVSIFQEHSEKTKIQEYILPIS